MGGCLGIYIKFEYRGSSTLFPVKSVNKLVRCLFQVGSFCTYVKFLQLNTGIQCKTVTIK